MSTVAPGLTARRWRTRRSAAVGGIVFAVLLIIALVILRLALVDASLDEIVANPHQQSLIRLGLSMVPFAGIAFLWFIGVIRDQLGDVEDRLFSTVFLGSGLLFLAMLFMSAVTAVALMTMVPGKNLDAGLWEFGRHTTEALVSTYAMRMAAVFTLTVSTVALRTRAVPRWLAFLGYAVALVLLVAAGAHRWVQLAFPAWVLVLSIAILVTRPAAGAPVSESEPRG